MDFEEERMKRAFLGMTFVIAFLPLTCGMAVAADKVTVLYDAFGDSKQLTKDWGFSVLVEHDGKRILFDSGNNVEIFEHNAKALAFRPCDGAEVSVEGESDGDSLRARGRREWIWGYGGATLIFPARC
jgi:hypothetical protein